MKYTYFVDLSSWYIIAFLASIAVGTALSSVVDWLNMSKTGLNAAISRIRSINNDAKRLFTTRSVNKAVEYKRTVDDFDGCVDTISSTVATLVVLFGITPFMVNTIHGYFPSLGAVWCWVITSIALTVVSSTAYLVPSYYSEFVIEKRFGFSNTTKKTFFSDFAKDLAVTAATIAALQYLLDLALKFFGRPSLTCVIAVAVSIFLVSAVMGWLTMNVIMPMFNKFEPLSDKVLADKLERLCRKCNFKVSKIEVMDASHRSNHSNAFICGAFGKKRIVLFDTMLKNMTHGEIVAVVGHEIGHGKLHHLFINNIEHYVTTTVSLAVVFGLMWMPSFYNAFGYTWIDKGNVSDHLIIGFNLAMGFVAVFKWILTPFNSWLSRKHEYAADMYSAKMTNRPEDLVAALLKLSSENLSDINPHPVYEFVNYSHPSILRRIDAIRKLKPAKRHRGGHRRGGARK